MKILPIKTQYKHNKPAFGSGQNGNGMQSQGIVFPLQGITSKTAQKLYSLDYTPVSKPRDGYFLTYVLADKTSEPVDIYVKRLYSYFRNSKDTSLNNEKYILYREKPDGSLKLVGARWMTFDIQGKTIAPGHMDSYDKELKGTGLRLQQIGVERMMDMDFENVKITSIPEAYDFHKKAGFQSSDVRRVLEEEDKNGYISLWASELGIRKNKIKEMLVYDKVSGVSEDYRLFNENKTFENFILYLKRKGRAAGAEIGLKMELGLNALADWKNIAISNSIFHGKLRELR